MATEKAQATRERILLAADKLFYQYGYHATGLERIIADAEITKGNFYYHFKSKEALAINTLDWHFEKITHDIAELESANTSPLTTLFAVLDYFTRLIADQKQAGGVFGCYFGNFTLELSNENPAVATRLKSIFSNYHALFKDLLERADSAGELPDHIDTEQAAGITVSLLEGAIVIDKANQEPKEILRAVNFLKTYLETG